jgi:uncharacterized protein (TIGR02145 family)
LPTVLVQALTKNKEVDKQIINFLFLKPIFLFMKQLQLICSIGTTVFLAFFATASYAQTIPVVSKNGAISTTDANFVDKNGRVGGSSAITADGKEVVISASTDVFCASGATIIVDVTTATGRTWMDRNLGATQVATSSTDANAYGDLYQWGRRSDGHQCRNSATTTALSAVDQPVNGNFIKASNSPRDWRDPQNDNLWQGVNGINNPCPTGYRLPTETELNEERLSWSPNNNATGAFNSVLKLPMAGSRSLSNGSLTSVGGVGGYWSSTVSGTSARSLGFNSSNAIMYANSRVFGFSVRCLKDASVALSTPTVTPTIGTYTFSGAPQGPTTATNTGTGIDYTFSYAGVSPTVYAASASLPTAAGNYTVTVTVAANGDFTSASSVATAFTIAIVTPTYPAGSVFCASGATIIVDVTTATGRTWMDRNLGATQVATSSTDANAYGNLYQWGRRSDGHQCRTSARTNTLSAVDQPANGNFIRAPNSPSDWRNPQNDNLWQGVNGINNPCPTGYRLPTETELNQERLSWSPNNNATGAFNSVLKLPVAGARDSSFGSLTSVGSFGGYWSSTVRGTNARVLYFFSSNAFMTTNNRAFGFSVRCLKD